MAHNHDEAGRPWSDQATTTWPSLDGCAMPTASARGDDLERALTTLSDGSRQFARTTFADRIRLAEECLSGVFAAARDWVNAACEAKGIASGSPCRAEEITAGPMIAARQLRLIIRTLRDIQAYGRPRLPGPLRVGADGRLRVPILPVRGLYDQILFPSFRAQAYMQAGVTQENLYAHLECPRQEQPAAPVALVLGAGNVSAIPATDSFSKIFSDGCVVLLKMHPVNQYLGPIFQRAFAPLVKRGFLSIVDGGADIGSRAIADNRVQSIHITGSIDTHDLIVWGPSGAERHRRIAEHAPLLTKRITSELGNVSPWIIMPGSYSRRQLRFQAENIAASMVNNASFNCAATRVLITPRRWAYRNTLVDMIQHVLDRTPERQAYYPGALDRFRAFTGLEPDIRKPGTLPWTLIRNVDSETPSQLFSRESFTSVCVEVPLEGGTEADFLDRAVQFANDRLWGTLCAAITVPAGFRAHPRNSVLFQQCLGRLRFGCVGINQWPGLMYCLVSPPWGGYPGSHPADVQSGVGWVHNTYLLCNVEKTVLDGPLTILPKPIWFPSHGAPEPVAWAALDLYRNPSVTRLSKLLPRAAFGHFAAPPQAPHELELPCEV